jgi:hypothetical protein
MTINEIATVTALLAGPIVAVLITRWLEERRLTNSRRMDIFRTLMRTRRTTLSLDHIGALNLIEIEYAKDTSVLTAWRALFTHLNTEPPRKSSERTEELYDQQEKTNRDNAYALRVFSERQTLLAKLLHSMSRVLGFKQEQLEIFEGGYTPQGWVNLETDQEIIRRYVIDMYNGKRVLPVGVMYSKEVPSPPDNVTPIKPP